MEAKSRCRKSHNQFFTPPRPALPVLPHHLSEKFINFTRRWKNFFPRRRKTLNYLKKWKFYKLPCPRGELLILFKGNHFQRKLSLLILVRKVFFFWTFLKCGTKKQKIKSVNNSKLKKKKMAVVEWGKVIFSSGFEIRKKWRRRFHRSRATKHEPVRQREYQNLGCSEFDFNLNHWFVVHCWLLISQQIKTIATWVAGEKTKKSRCKPKTAQHLIFICRRHNSA